MLAPLAAVEQVPAVDLQPSALATRERQAPAGTGQDVPEEWGRYWTAPWPAAASA